MITSNTANPYKDEQLHLARQGAGSHSNSSQSLPSISVMSTNQNNSSKPRSNSQNRRGSDQEDLDVNLNSIEIVNLAVDNTSKLPKVASAEDGESLYIDLREDDDYEGAIIVEKDKLFEPSIDFKPE